MKTMIATALGALAAVASVTGAQAASIDLTPVINEAISDILVPVLVATVPTVAAVLVLPVRRFFDQKAGSDLALRVNDVLDKAIAYGAKQAQAWVGDHDFHATVDNGITSLAVEYALSHAPALMKQAGVAVSAKAGDFVKSEADRLLQQKIAARLDAHPDVAAVKAMASASAPPVAKAA